ncbi:MAG: prolipoprotein diacylglyceryl transferase, partial [Burkholderiales bacterium]|nr:prolipoprotein diacylglyceryl transferase [Burkholderiales bacterium]
TRSPVAAPDLMAGFNLMWSPWPLLLLQAVGLASFVYSGRSEVTSARVTIDIHPDRI